MKLSKKIAMAGIPIAFVWMLIFPKWTLEGSRTGLTLWFETILPTLLPFLILSSVCIKGNLIRGILSFIQPVCNLIFGTSPEGTYSLFCGFFCGFPMGAKLLADFRRKGQMTKKEGEYLLGFCNNVSPAFVVTYLYQAQLSAALPLGWLLLALYGMPLCYGLCCRILFFPLHSQRNDWEKNISPARISFELVDASILESLITIGKIGVYILLFSILGTYVQHLPFPYPMVKGILACFLELTSGIPWLLSGGSPLSLLFLMPLCVFGGLSALFQTKSMLKETDLSLGSYLRSKLRTGFLSFFVILFYLTRN